MADAAPNPLKQPLPNGMVLETVVARTERRWVTLMAAMLVAMMTVIVGTGVVQALHPASNVETVDPTT
ncbi:MAG: cytochrome C oxidase subunit II, partial [Alphaproteobacteria bacterium]|nr:cytochrome C oxidase subunit II [Alphaproteobacteria bacterium]